MGERSDFGTIKPEAKVAAQRLQNRATSVDTSRDSSSKISRRHFLRNALGATFALATGAVGLTEVASRNQPLPSSKPQIRLTPESTPQNEGEVNRRKMLHEIDGMRQELKAIDQMVPQPEMKININGEIITAFTVGSGPDQQKYSKKTLDLDIANKNSLHSHILEANTVLAFADGFLKDHPEYSDVALQGWLRREYDFTVQVPHTSGGIPGSPVTVDTYQISVTSTYSPDWEDIPDQTPGGLIRPQKKNFDFTIKPVALGQPVSSSQKAMELGGPKTYSFPNGFDVEYTAGPKTDHKPRFLTGERNRSEAPQDKLHFIQDYIVPILASVRAEDESNLLNEDVGVALTPSSTP